MVYNDGINLKILMSHNNSFQNCPMYGVACQCYDSTSDSPQISASPHQLVLAPYALRSYSAQWNALGLLHDKHTLRSSRILGEMEVEEPEQGLWLPLHYQVDKGAS